MKHLFHNFHTICLLTILSVMLLLTTPLSAISFSDTSGHWAESYITYDANYGLLSGYPDGTFLPDKSITRAELVKVLYTLSGENISSGEKPFTDVDKSFWACDAITWAKDNSIVNGYENNIFMPNKYINRQEMVTIIYRYINNYRKSSVLVLTDDRTFTDEDKISSWAYEAVHAMVKSAIITGRTDNSFDPVNNITRAETCVVIYRYLLYYEDNSNYDLSLANVYVDNILVSQSNPCYTKNQRVMLPVRNLLGALNYNINYYSIPGLILLTRGITDAELFLNKAEIYVNGTSMPLTTAPELTNGTTYVAAKEILSALGYQCTISTSDTGDIIYVKITSLDDSLLTENGFYGSVSTDSGASGTLRYISGTSLLRANVEQSKISWGSYLHSDGSFETGQWNGNTLNGTARTVSANGDFFTGTYSNGVRYSGTMFFVNGATFTGKWTKNSSDNAVYPCTGTYTDKNGTVYGSDDTTWSNGAITIK